MNQNSLQWYAVYTKPRWEKKVLALFARSHIQAYCPLNRVQKQWHDRKKWVEEPLFASYVFVCIAPNEQATVRKTLGVLNFVYWLGKPALVRPEDIEAIKTFLEAHRSVQIERTRVHTDDRVKITGGPLQQREGRVVEVGSKTVKVLLPTLGYTLVAAVDKEHVQVVAPAECTKKAR